MRRSEQVGSETKYLFPDWPAPGWVKACSTRRFLGGSQGPFAGFNLATHVGDAVDAVEHNRTQLKQDLELPQSPIWLQQTHSARVVEAKFALEQTHALQADALFTGQPDQVCAVLTADCLPVLFTSEKGDWVAAVHAGWRGLCDGILENTLSAFAKSRARSGAEDTRLIAWIGPAIGAAAFEVGADVYRAFCANEAALRQFFKSSGRAKYTCDLFGIARHRLAQKNVATFGGDHCTFSEADDFYSCRREGTTGRIASLIWIEPQGRT